jgi:hypothetical protein
VVLCCGWTRRRCFGRPRCSPTRSRTGASMTGANTNCNCCSGGPSYRGMQGTKLQRSLIDGLPPVLCI